MIEAAQANDSIVSPADNRFPFGDAGMYYSIVSVQRSKIDGGRCEPVRIICDIRRLLTSRCSLPWHRSVRGGGMEPIMPSKITYFGDPEGGRGHHGESLGSLTVPYNCYLFRWPGKPGCSV